jgi:hypothetical protein
VWENIQRLESFEEPVKENTLPRKHMYYSEGGVVHTLIINFHSRFFKRHSFPLYAIFVTRAVKMVLILRSTCSNIPKNGDANTHFWKQTEMFCKRKLEALNGLRKHLEVFSF